MNFKYDISDIVRRRVDNLEWIFIEAELNRCVGDAIEDSIWDAVKNHIETPVWRSKIRDLILRIPIKS
jgi:hypothetical protein